MAERIISIRMPPGPLLERIERMHDASGVSYSDIIRILCAQGAALAGGIVNACVDTQLTSEYENGPAEPAPLPPPAAPPVEPPEPERPRTDPRTDVPTPPELDTPAFRQALEDYFIMRRRKRMGTWLPETLERQYRKMAAAGLPAAIAALKNSTEQEYQGVFLTGGRAPKKLEIKHEPGWGDSLDAVSKPLKEEP